jgi:SH3-like domain-containing protein
VREKSCRPVILGLRMKKVMIGVLNVIYPSRDSPGKIPAFVSLLLEYNVNTRLGPGIKKHCFLLFKAIICG